MDDGLYGVSCFTQSEIMEMENLFEEFGEETLGQEFCQDLALSFSNSSGCSGNMFVRWDEVQDWFRHKQKVVAAKYTSSPYVSMEIDAFPEEPMPDEPMPNDAPQNSIVPIGDMILQDISELTYEAKSSKDDAWYDVCAFLTYRYVSSGELFGGACPSSDTMEGFEALSTLYMNSNLPILQEARVRFSGFNNEEDEWVNVKSGVRKRSIPLEDPSECSRVKVGDLVLCFQERSDQAVYCDAHVIEIQRRLHDIMGCRCIFLVRYVHDNAEEKVSLKRLCCRPTH